VRPWRDRIRNASSASSQMEVDLEPWFRQGFVSPKDISPESVDIVVLCNLSSSLSVRSRGVNLVSKTNENK
jgi:hypothetical protein